MAETVLSIVRKILSKHDIILCSDAGRVKIPPFLFNDVVKNLSRLRMVIVDCFDRDIIRAIMFSLRSGHITYVCFFPSMDWFDTICIKAQNVKTLMSTLSRNISILLDEIFTSETITTIDISNLHLDDKHYELISYHLANGSHIENLYMPKTSLFQKDLLSPGVSINKFLRDLTYDGRHF